MAETGRLSQTAVASPAISPVTLLRVAIILAVLAAWEFLAHSGWLYRDVVPSLLSIGRAMATLLTDRNYYYNLGVTAAEIVRPWRSVVPPASWSGSFLAPIAFCPEPSSPISIISDQHQRSFFFQL